MLDRSGQSLDIFSHIQSNIVFLKYLWSSVLPLPIPSERRGSIHTHKIESMSFPSNFHGVLMWLRDQEPSCKRVVASNGSAAKSPSPAIFEARISSCESAWSSPREIELSSRFLGRNFWAMFGWKMSLRWSCTQDTWLGVVAADLCPWHFAGSAG